MKKLQHKIKITIQDCPRHKKCSAPICPLDSEWSKRSLHNVADGICPYQMMSIQDAEAAFAADGLAEIYRVICQVSPAIISRHDPIRMAIEKKKNSIRMQNMVGG